jgi:hypothetical protein
VLAQGTTRPPGDAWHALALRCAGDRISATLDGQTLTTIQDTTYLRGLVGITSRFHVARFDALEITNLSP